MLLVDFYKIDVNEFHNTAAVEIMSDIEDEVLTAQAVKMLRSFRQLKDDRCRKAVFDLVQAMANS